MGLRRNHLVTRLLEVSFATGVGRPRFMVRRHQSFHTGSGISSRQQSFFQVRCRSDVRIISPGWPASKCPDTRSPRCCWSLPGTHPWCQSARSPSRSEPGKSPVSCGVSQLVDLRSCFLVNKQPLQRGGQNALSGAACCVQQGAALVFPISRPQPWTWVPWLWLTRSICNLALWMATLQPFTYRQMSHPPRLCWWIHWYRHPWMLWKLQLGQRSGVHSNTVPYSGTVP